MWLQGLTGYIPIFLHYFGYSSSTRCLSVF
nr:MAG TPA_asm: hypothetical protein [Caudoviricetes sp.]